MKTTFFFLLIVICSTAVFPHITLAQDDRPIVQVVYFRASDQATPPDVDTEIDGLIKVSQLFFADEMERHGFGRKTFQIEIDANGNTVVHHVVGKFPYTHYLEDGIFSWADETDEHLGISSSGDDFVVYMIETRGEKETPDNAWGHGGTIFFGGHANIYLWHSPIVSHELGHAFNLSHDHRDGAYIMSYGKPRNQLSKCAAEWLDVHRVFTPGQPLRSSTKTTIKLLSLTSAPPPNALHLRLKVTDPNGIQQVQLRLKEISTGPRRADKSGGLIACHRFHGNPSGIVEFVIPKLPLEQTEIILIWVIDRHGSMTQQRFVTETEIRLRALSDRPAADVNGDTVIDIEDLMFVAASIGTAPAPGTLPDTDVNNDGEVNDADVALVLAALEEAPAAPALDAQWRAASLQRWIAEAKRRNIGDATFQRGIKRLEQILADLIPKQTILLANYPNPFNPETWVPYQLSKPGDVILHIYSVKGALIRTLTLGHQPTGMYHSKSRAAYWDGRNQLGESVASGVYFYTLSAGDFTATRKLLIRK